MSDTRLQLIEDLSSYAYDPHGFVHWAFPWGEGELEGFEGPDEWQTKFLEDFSEKLKDSSKPIRFARASGHGVGKSALVAWLTLWAYTTFPGTRGLITANTEVQLKTRTWVELQKWSRLFVGSELLQLNATTLYTKAKKIDKEWRVDIIPWSEKNPSAFQGLHNKGKRLFLIFDEAAEIPKIIWEAAQGALTDENTEIFWLVFGNPSDPNFMFRECFKDGKFEKRWDYGHVDGRDSAITNKEEIAGWIEDYGEDDDFIRVRVRGVFPSAAASSFISFEKALEAARRPLILCPDDPVILGVDVARFGNDFSVIYPRQGRDARSREVEIYQGLSTTELAAKVAVAFRKHGASVAMVDGTGVGGGTVDRLRELRIPVIDVQFGAGADGIDSYEPQAKCANKRTEIWLGLRHFLNVGCIVEQIPYYRCDLTTELAQPRYTINARDELALEPKAVTKRQFGSSDAGDALACTFAMPWIEDLPEGTGLQSEVVKDYNPYDEERVYAGMIH